MLQLFYLPVLTLILLLYFRIASRLNIIDKPNHRSSHSSITIRGGGLIFPVALIIHFCIDGFNQPYFIIGLFLISLISFIDDIKPLSNRLRISVHIISVFLLFYQLELFHYPYIVVLIWLVVIIGAINAYNFMDGINGITGSYSLIAIMSLGLVNESIEFINYDWIVVAGLAFLTFNYFNFRQNAKCFAGDVGSVSAAFIVLFFILLLVMKTGELKFIGFLLLYGLDSISTIIFRLIRRENIFLAHRSHFYQYLANNLRWPHLLVASTYGGVQMCLNIIIIQLHMDSMLFLIFVLCAASFFLATRYLVEGKKVLLGHKI
ncbi:MAG: MraY family glycosyltransferase [Daejeonella sp.]